MLEVNSTHGTWNIFFYTLQGIFQVKKTNFTVLLSLPLIIRMPYLSYLTRFHSCSYEFSLGWDTQQTLVSVITD